MIKISDLRLPVEAGEEELLVLTAKQLRIRPEAIRSLEILKRSLDARKKPELSFVYSVRAEVRKEQEILRKNKNRKITRYSDPEYVFPDVRPAEGSLRPVIAGSGPAGLFGALLLAEHGFRPVLLERGDRVDIRKAKVDSFWKGGAIDPESNVQFGEGGAGTFSDGKLNTMTHDPGGRGRFVLETFVRFGAPASILYDQKPHIGTDLLTEIVRNMRIAIESAGGEVRFRSALTDIYTKDGMLTGVEINGSERMEADTLILAVGHSARDTYEMLLRRGLAMTPKAFAVGLRVQHPQKMIDLDQYGRESGGLLSPAAYKLTAHSSNDRGVYTFCMCPGGYVVNASSEEGHLAVNGMSYSDRGGENANSAVIVTVTPEDYLSYTHPMGPVLSGAAFQEELERKAYRIADGALPVQRWDDFAAGRATAALGDVRPCMKGRYELASLKGLMPGMLEEAFSDGIRSFGTKIKGFDRPDMLLCGIESRTSSPVRMQRDETFSSNIGGILPCGEGAGYAGGITSAAADGVRVAEACAARLSRPR